MPFKNPEDRRAYLRRNRERFRKSRNEAKRRHYYKHRERILCEQRERRLTSYNLVARETKKLYYEINRDRILARQKTEKGRAQATAQNKKRHASRLRLTCDCCSLADFRKIYEIASADRMHVDHIIPLSKNGPHCCKNLQLLTPFENMSKGTSL